MFGSQRLARQSLMAGLTRAGLSTLLAVGLPTVAAAKGMLGAKTVATNGTGRNVG
jgi:hypothetical protein